MAKFATAMGERPPTPVVLPSRSLLSPFLVGRFGSPAKIDYRKNKHGYLLK